MTFHHSYVYHRADRALKWKAAQKAIDALTHDDLEEAFGEDDISLVGEMYQADLDECADEDASPGYILSAVQADLRIALDLIERSDRAYYGGLTLRVGEYIVTLAGHQGDEEGQEVQVLSLLKLFPKICRTLGLEPENT
jgi:hypothetical protein